jgi:hypothetical protein
VEGFLKRSARVGVTFLEKLYFNFPVQKWVCCLLTAIYNDFIQGASTFFLAAKFLDKKEVFWQHFATYFIKAIKFNTSLLSKNLYILLEIGITITKLQ